MLQVTGLELADATRIITQDLKLTIGTVERVSSSEYPEGQVCYQSTAPYTLVAEGTVINLRVSTGPAASEQPVETEPPTVVTEAPPVEQTTPPAPKTSRKEVRVNLPSDRDTVTVRILVGGVEKVPAQQVDTRMQTARFTVEGSGHQTVDVYLDDSLYSSTTMDFSS